MSFTGTPKLARQEDFKQPQALHKCLTAARLVDEHARKGFPTIRPSAELAATFAALALAKSPTSTSPSVSPTKS